MGVFAAQVQVGPLDGSRYEAVEAIVDTGASYTTIGRSILERLGVAPEARRQFRLADGGIAELDVGYARLRAAGEDGIVAVCFGPDGGPALLGATSLQILSLAVDPVGERLVPAVGYMLELRPATPGASS
jgi:predicted aspartyl protease